MKCHSPCYFRFASAGAQVFAIGLFFHAVAYADPSDATAMRQVRVQVEFVEMDHREMTKLLFLSRPEVADVTPLRMTVAEMVREGKAEVIETMMVATGSGMKATTESVREFIFPTEYEPPALPDQIDLPESADPEDISADELKWMGLLRTQYAPTAFETRNLGKTLEVEPTIADDGRSIRLRMVPEIVWHTGTTVWAEDKDSFGNVSKVQVPEFYVLRLNTEVICMDGQYNLIAALSPKDQNGATDYSRKVMVFVKCDVLDVTEVGE